MELPQKYPPEHYAQKAHRYAVVVRYGFGADVDQDTEQRWAQLIGMARAIDTYLDEGEPESLSVRSRKSLDFIADPGSVATEFPALDPEKIGGETYGRLRYFGGQIIRLNQRIAETAEYSRFVRLRRLEGRQYARLIGGVATDQVRQQPAYRRFSNWLVPVGEATNLVNSFHGLKRDYECGETRVQPDVVNRLRLLGHTAYSLAVARQTVRTNDRRLN